MAHLPSDRRRPQDYGELCQEARHELRLAVLVLEDRAERLQQFLDAFDTIEGSPVEIARLAKATYCHDHEDHLVPALREIVSNWPQVALGPGEGYW